MNSSLASAIKGSPAIFMFMLCSLPAISIAVSASSLAQTPIIWQELVTKHTIIRYQSMSALCQLEYKLRFGPGTSGLLALLSHNNDQPRAHKVKRKVDAIFERVQEILGMRKAMNRVRINLYENKEQLNQAYKEIYGLPCRIRAWYRHSDNTIYLNIKDLHEGMLAHEMAHSIIDNYLTVRPPRATAEILARYVDLHLKD